MQFGGLLIPLAVIAGIVVLVVRAVRKHAGEEGHEEPTPAGTVVRRIFQYGMLFAALMLAAVGVVGLLGALFEPGTTVQSASELALPLSLTIVGVPLFAGLALWTRRTMADDPSEQRSMAWLLYLTAALLVSLVAAIIEGSITLSWAFGDRSRDAGELAAACVWVAIWATHWWIGERRPPRDELRLHRVAGSAISLGMMMVFGISSAAIVLGWVYDQLFRTTLVSTIGSDLRDVVPVFAVGSVAWIWYWLVHGSHDIRTSLWHAYVLLIGVLPGLITALVAVAVALFGVLEWLFGTVEGTTADHFAASGPVIAAFIGGLALLAYHRGLIQKTRGEARTPVDQVYDYLVAAVGLGASAVGLTMLIAAAIEAITPGTIADNGAASGVDTLLLAVTLFVVGGPVWWYFWARVQRHAAADPVEAGSTTRRLYLFISFGVGGVISVVSVIVGLSTVLRDILDGTAGGDTLYQIRVAIALVVTAGTVAGYHWMVFREDRRRAGAEAPAVERRLRTVLLVAGATPGLGPAVAEATGIRPQVWVRLDADGRSVDPADVVAAISATDAERVMVLVDPDGRIRAVPIGLPG